MIWILTIFLIFNSYQCEILRVPLVKKQDTFIHKFEKSLSRIISGGYPEELSNFMNTQYYGILGVGSPPQLFEFMFDTGSSDAWVLSTSCGFNNIPCLLHWTKYNNKKSHTYNPIGTRFVIPYAQGDVSGFLSSDKFTMGNITIPQQIFGEVDTIPLKFIGIQFDGIIGLGFQSLSVFDKKPFFYNLLDQNKRLEPIFSVYLGQSRNGEKNIGGEIVFGGFDLEYFKPPLRSVPVVSERYWAIKIESIKTDSITICDQGCKAVIDTGTSLILGPMNQVNKLNIDLGATSLNFGSIYRFDCQQLDHLRDVTFSIGGYNYIITKDEYVLHIAGQCLSAFMGIDIHSKSMNNVWILGDVFIRRYYTVFDLQRRIISFAEVIVKN